MGHRIVVATGDALSERLAGPGIRARHMAEALGAHHDVRLVSTSSCTLADQADHRCEAATDDDAWRELGRWADVLVYQGYLLQQYPSLAESDLVVIADLYDPFHLEQLELYRLDDPERREEVVSTSVRALNGQLRRGDAFLCASDRQRLFWLGGLSAMGRINPATYDRDPTGRRLIDVVPFGLPSEPPVRTGAGIRGVTPGIGDDELVLLWGGGIYNWFDPLTLVRAVAQVRSRVPQIRLVFLGGGHPNPEIDEMRMAVDARHLAQDLGVAGRHVIFNEGWVPYDERQNHFLDADVGVSCHLDHLETELSFRTRVLDYLWCGLPMVCTQGDALAEMVEQEGLGRTVPAADVDALADAIATLADPDERRRCAARVAAVAERFTWEKALAPLVALCEHPERAPDAGALADPLEPPPVIEPTYAQRARVVLRDTWEDGGAPAVARRAAGAARRRARRLVGRPVPEPVEPT
ncbi:MAG: glycosyltransferase [Acidimicrobiia bacterium]|nr:glycosyltransferase [Acidimicrobiia bacterium]